MREKGKFSRNILRSSFFFFNLLHNNIHPFTRIANIRVNTVTKPSPGPTYLGKIAINLINVK